MDKKKALQILGLGSGATRDQAKKAFRSLAKSCHPDRFAKDVTGADTAEIRMKEINAAFHFLSPLLPISIASPVIEENRSTGWPDFFSTVRKKWKKRQKPSRPTVSPKRSTPRQPVAGKAQGNSRTCFETVLSSVEPVAVKTRVKKEALPTAAPRPYENYCRYLSVTRKIKGAKNRSKNMTGRVEKISPISPVDSIGRE